MVEILAGGRSGGGRSHLGAMHGKYQKSGAGIICMFKKGVQIWGHVTDMPAAEGTVNVGVSESSFWLRGISALRGHCLGIHRYAGGDARRGSLYSFQYDTCKGTSSGIIP